MQQRRTLAELSGRDRELVIRALEASEKAYAPYSGFAVGAAVRTHSGQVFVGANLENASYRMVTCAEIAALSAANSSGVFDVETIAVAGHKFAPNRDFSHIVSPCGGCRQAISEAAQVARRDVTVLSCNGDLSVIVEGRISELIPDAFGPDTLGTADVWRQMKGALEASVGDLLQKTRR